jgi:hypothetical protein
MIYSLEKMRAMAAAISVLALLKVINIIRLNMLFRRRVGSLPSL